MSDILKAKVVVVTGSAFRDLSPAAPDSSGRPAGRSNHNRLLQGFHIPAGSHKLRRQPIQQVGMRRRLPLRPEIFGGLHDPSAEVHLPEAVHRHARQQRIRRIHQPLGQPQPVWWIRRRRSHQHGGQHRRDRFTYTGCRGCQRTLNNASASDSIEVTVKALTSVPPKRITIDRDAFDVDSEDSLCIRDVVEGIRIEDQEIRFFSGGEHAHLVKLEVFGCATRG